MGHAGNHLAHLTARAVAIRGETVFQTTGDSAGAPVQMGRLRSQNAPAAPEPRATMIFRSLRILPALGAVTSRGRPCPTPAVRAATDPASTMRPDTRRRHIPPPPWPFRPAGRYGMRKSHLRRSRLDGGHTGPVSMSITDGRGAGDCRAYGSGDQPKSMFHQDPKRNRPKRDRSSICSPADIAKNRRLWFCARPLKRGMQEAGRRPNGGLSAACARPWPSRARTPTAPAPRCSGTARSRRKPASHGAPMAGCGPSGTCAATSAFQMNRTLPIKGRLRLRCAKSMP